MDPAASAPPRRNRVLTDEEDAMQFNAWDHAEWDEEKFRECEEKVAAQRVVLDEAAIEQYDAQAADYWDKFYQANETRFYQRRNYLHLEFDDVRGPNGDGGSASGEGRTLLEVGCGTGSSVFPLLKALPKLFVRAFDFSAKAVELVRTHAEYDASRAHAFVWDIAKSDVPQADVALGSVDVALMIYVLSAIAPADMAAVAARMFAVLKPGGVICLRDYGRYDLAQMRFKEARKLGDHFYVRGEGTRVYFFTKEELAALFEAAGFETLENGYDRRVLTNRKRKITMFRVWCQARFRKPLPGGAAPADGAAGVGAAAAANAGAILSE